VIEKLSFSFKVEKLSCGKILLVRSSSHHPLTRIVGKIEVVEILWFPEGQDLKINFRRSKKNHFWTTQKVNEILQPRSVDAIFLSFT
jgi:hypothetical protein